MKTSAPTPAGRLADLVAVTETPRWRESFPPITLAKIAVLSGLIVAVNWWQLQVLVWTWLQDPNWSHGFLIPLFSLFLLWNRRDELLRTPRQVSLLGLPIVLAALAGTLVGYYPIGTYWFCHLGLVMLIFGVVLYIGGRKIIRLAWLPILFLVFAMPIPEMLYSQIALPLQNLAAKCATYILRVFGVLIEVSASRLDIVSLSGERYPLTVAEACSGVRSLMAYLALGVAWAYLTDRPVWQRVVLVLMAAPVAVATNILRVLITCEMFVIDKPEFGKDFMHEMTGMLMLVPAVLMFWLIARVLDSLFVDVDADEESEAKEPQA